MLGTYVAPMTSPTIALSVLTPVTNVQVEALPTGLERAVSEIGVGGDIEEINGVPTELAGAQPPRSQSP